jgi:deoxycytidine triphosphate deaminase
MEMDAGLLSDQDIKRAIKNHNMYIIPFNEKNLTGVGYNLTPSEFVFSTQKGIVETIKERHGEKYVLVSAHDTVLVLTKENLWIDNTLAGTIHSRVRIVSQGFGHISTTVDPQWNGPLLIALSNPTARKLKLTLQKTGTTGTVDNTFCTVVLHRLATPSAKRHDNPPQRIDVLKEYVARPPRLLPYIFIKSKYEVFKNLILGINEKLPPYVEWETPTIASLKKIKDEFEKLYEYVYKNDSKFDGDRLCIGEELTDGSLFSENSMNNMQDSIKYLISYDFSENFDRKRLRQEMYNVLYHIKLEIKSKQYLEYLSYLEKIIPKMRPAFLGINDWFARWGSLLLLLVLITGSAIIAYNYITDAFVKQVIPVVAIVINLFFTMIKYYNNKQ